ncbi:MAG TPA: ShlB/FhaC/HecB family hemolysin secretion/activation protein [Desulfobacter sp.]|uniref:ShlB/FhaC/HecB family hemolysin secretion/activation protein n=1 Tax=Desulfobacter sp. UBA2225 TaxID=1961413 RepID=UPI000E8F9B89|nr:ShlB/FhaC/HecB family hemolysin secretion/activation protein [Desulfobacter sp. UBA2225]HAR32710.1 ShlB/FhaC/HecB family hemolysin secretion/activation protein [Desulfobacter sp.]
MKVGFGFKYIIYLGLILTINLNTPRVFAQMPLFPQTQRPSQERPPLPEYEKPAPPPLTLPPAIQSPDDSDRLSARFRVFVRKFKLTGNTVFADGELAEITKAYEGRVITSEELQEVRRKLTRLYVNAGYVNSGAVIPDQKVEKDIIHIQIIEGQLTKIEVEKNKWLSSKYIKKRLALGAQPVLNTNQLRQHLQLLQQNQMVKQLHTELGPGIKPGEGILEVRVKEEPPFESGLIFANDCSPSVGAERGRIYLAHHSLTGWSDTLGVQYGLTEGEDEFSVFYTRPLNAYDTTLRLEYDKTDCAMIEEPFDDLDIESDLETYSISLTHPFYRTPQRVFSMGLALDLRHSRTYLLGRPFSFSPGVQDGESDVTVLRFSQEWLDRSFDQVIAIRSIFSIGIDAMGATSGEEPDGQYLAWLGQFQWARRFSNRGDQVILRTDLQLAEDSLLPMERISVGGAKTVRGYRENQLVRDNALVTSLEFRIPVFRLPIPGISRGFEEGMVQVAPFADFGWAWNTDLPTPDPDTISSVGLGVRWDPSPRIHCEIYWGLALRDFDNPDENLQDSGIHFLVSWHFPFP